MSWSCRPVSMTRSHEARGHHAVSVAVAAIAREAHVPLYALEERAVGRVHQQRAGGEEDGVLQAAAVAASGGGACRPGRDNGRCRIAEEALPDEGLVHHAVDGRALLQKADERAPGGMPEMNDLVPSMGSSATHNPRRGARCRILADDAVSGKVVVIMRRITCSAARSASVTGSKLWPLRRPFVSTPMAVRKKGRMASPERVARSWTKASRANGGHERNP